MKIQLIAREPRGSVLNASRVITITCSTNTRSFLYRITKSIDDILALYAAQASGTYSIGFNIPNGVVPGYAHELVFQFQKNMSQASYLSLRYRLRDLIRLLRKEDTLGLYGPDKGTLLPKRY